MEQGAAPRRRIIAHGKIRGKRVLVNRALMHLDVIREDGKPARVEPLRDVRPAFDGPNPQRVAAWPKGAA